MAATEAQKKAYYAKMLPYGKKVEAKIGLPAQTVVAWWSWETDHGTNKSSKSNNHAGIKANSKGRDYVAGIYAGYNSIDSFVNDYCRLLSLDMAGYPEIIKAGKTPGTLDDTKAHNASSWSEADYNVATIQAREKEIQGVTPGKPIPIQALCPHCQNPVSLQKA